MLIPSANKPLFIFFCLFSLAASRLSAQITDPNTNHVDIITTDVFEYTEEKGVKVQKLTGHVHLRQDTTDFYCDTAIRYIDTNYVIARSNVRIVFSDSMDIRSDKLTYDGHTKICELYNHIVLTRGKTTLKTNRMTFYREENYGYYFNGGVIQDTANTLTSVLGYYYPDTNMAYFKKDVKLVNDKFTLTTDTMGYNTATKTAYFLAPTTVKDSSSTMYTEKGYYDTRKGKALLYQNAQVGDTSYTLFADTIRYERDIEFGKAIGHVRVIQADSGLKVFGNYGEFWSAKEESYITDSAWAVNAMEDDTLYLFADTLRSVNDTVNDRKIFCAYGKTRFFLNEMQGKADSLAYLYEDSIIRFFDDPVIWSRENQITGDTIEVFMKNSKVDSIAIPSNAFIVVKEDTVGFNQVKGLKLFAKLDSNKLKHMWVFGNSESIYYAKDENDHYVGVNNSKCVDMTLFFLNNKPARIVFLDHPSGTFFPLADKIFTDFHLDGFSWRIKERPEHPQVEWPEGGQPVLKPDKDPGGLQQDSEN